MHMGRPTSQHAKHASASGDASIARAPRHAIASGADGGFDEREGGVDAEAEQGEPETRAKIDPRRGRRAYRRWGTPRTRVPSPLRHLGTVTPPYAPGVRGNRRRRSRRRRGGGLATPTVHVFLPAFSEQQRSCWYVSGHGTARDGKSEKFAPRHPPTPVAENPRAWTSASSRGEKRRPCLAGEMTRPSPAGRKGAHTGGATAIRDRLHPRLSAPANTQGVAAGASSRVQSDDQPPSRGADAVVDALVAREDLVVEEVFRAAVIHGVRTRNSRARKRRTRT